VSGDVGSAGVGGTVVEGSVIGVGTRGSGASR
jgi:hypothetical protein